MRISKSEAYLIGDWSNAIVAEPLLPAIHILLASHGRIDFLECLLVSDRDSHAQSHEWRGSGFTSFPYPALSVASALRPLCSVGWLVNGASITADYDRKNPTRA